MDHFCQISICPGEGRLSVHMTSNYNPVINSPLADILPIFSVSSYGINSCRWTAQKFKTLSVEDQNKKKIIVNDDRSKILMFYMIVGREAYCVHWKNIQQDNKRWCIQQVSSIWANWKSYCSLQRERVGYTFVIRKLQYQMKVSIV